MHLFYEPNITTNGYLLNEEESYHCVKVLRHKAGDIINVIDGKGYLFECKIVEPSVKQCKVIIQREEAFSDCGSICHIAIAPTKNIDRMEWFVEKSTEIGIKEITPILCKHSERKILKTERLEKIITSAVKQSKSLWQPKLNPLVCFNEFVTEYKCFDGEKFICYIDDKNNKTLIKSYSKNNPVIILIGPEGDFDKKEIDQALSSGFKAVSLGNNRLRTETAAFVACHTIQIMNQF